MYEDWRTIIKETLILYIPKKKASNLSLLIKSLTVKGLKY